VIRAFQPTRAGKPNWSARNAASQQKRFVSKKRDFETSMLHLHLRAHGAKN
jgi:hypothetical protein